MVMWMWWLMMTGAWSAESRLVPAVLRAAQSWEAGAIPWSRETVAIHQVWRRSGFEPGWLRSRAQRGLKRSWVLPPAGPRPTKMTRLPAFALHAWKLEVREPSDDVWKDDVYAYFFVTVDGVTTGRVTGVQRHVAAGGVVMFAPDERGLFPMSGGYAVPGGTLHVDYGVVESDGDDVTRLRELTGLVVDLAIAYYAVMEPQGGHLAIQLRQEVRALAEAIASLDRDDRLAAGSFTVGAGDVPLPGEWRELTRRHRSRAFFDSWDYRLSWRLMAE
jgi:hypothetical protein